MALKHQQQAATERRYSPEEAGEILRLAANLQENSFSMERLRSIAHEAGVSDENLQRAVQEYEQQRKALQFARARKTENLFVVATIVALIVLTTLAFAFMLWTTSIPPQSPSQRATAIYASEREGLLASSSTCKVYKDGSIVENNTRYEIVKIQNLSTNESFVVGHRFNKVVSASISPSGEYIALYDESNAEVWVVSTDGSSLQCVASRSGGLIGYENPLAGWSSDGTHERLRLRTAEGEYTYVHVEE